MARVIRGGCGRCGGDLFPDGEAEDQEWVCLQCGYRKYLNVLPDGYSELLHQTYLEIKARTEQESERKRREKES